MSLVHELQRDSLDKNISVSDLLRKSLVVARKLKIVEFQEWIQKELEGYNDVADIPEYRVAHGTVKAWNPFRGWQAVFFEDIKEAKILSRRPNGQRIAELESLLENKSNKLYQMPFPKDIEQQLRKSIGFDTNVTLMTSITDLVRTIDAVRNIITELNHQLSW